MAKAMYQIVFIIIQSQLDNSWNDARWVFAVETRTVCRRLGLRPTPQWRNVSVAQYHSLGCKGWMGYEQGYRPRSGRSIRANVRGEEWREGKGEKAKMGRTGCDWGDLHGHLESNNIAFCQILPMPLIQADYCAVYGEPATAARNEMLSYFEIM
jgi:hypothetical protein